MKVYRSADGTVFINDLVMKDAKVVSLKENNDHSVDVTVVIKADEVIFTQNKKLISDINNLLSRLDR